jgi:hypothetical protein
MSLERGLDAIKLGGYDNDFEMRFRILGAVLCENNYYLRFVRRESKQRSVSVCFQSTIRIMMLGDALFLVCVGISNFETQLTVSTYTLCM